VQVHACVGRKGESFSYYLLGVVTDPIFGQVESFSGDSHDDFLRDSVDHKCDVEGLCHLYRTNLYRNVRYLDPPTNSEKCLLPCTALSVVKLLEECPGGYDHSKSVGRRMEGKVSRAITKVDVALSVPRSTAPPLSPPSTLLCPILDCLHYQSIRNCGQVCTAGLSFSPPLWIRPDIVLFRSFRPRPDLNRPLAALLSNDHADVVYSIDIDTIYRFLPGGRLEKCTEGETPESCVRKVSARYELKAGHIR
jgi:hypothetical protein